VQAAHIHHPSRQGRRGHQQLAHRVGGDVAELAAGGDDKHLAVFVREINLAVSGDGRRAESRAGYTSSRECARRSVPDARQYAHKRYAAPLRVRRFVTRPALCDAGAGGDRDRDAVDRRRQLDRRLEMTGTRNTMRPSEQE
jgi:hypothetical protein